MYICVFSYSNRTSSSRDWTEAWCPCWTCARRWSPPHASDNGTSKRPKPTFLNKWNKNKRWWGKKKKAIRWEIILFKGKLVTREKLDLNLQLNVANRPSTSCSVLCVNEIAHLIEAVNQEHKQLWTNSSYRWHKEEGINQKRSKILNDENLHKIFNRLLQTGMIISIQSARQSGDQDPSNQW